MLDFIDNATAVEFALTYVTLALIAGIVTMYMLIRINGGSDGNDKI